MPDQASDNEPGIGSQEVLARMQVQQRAIQRSDKAAALRQHMDTRNADKYYRSGQVSALGSQSVADTTLKPGEQPSPPLTRRLTHLDERNTDRYYRDVIVRSPTKQQVEQMQNQQRYSSARRLPAGQAVPQESATFPVQHSQHVHPLEVASQEDVRSAASAAAGLVLQGQTRVVIRVTGPQSLAMQVNTLLDGMATREEISESQRRDVHLDLSQAGTAGRVRETRSPDEIWGPAQAASRPAVSPKPLDVEAFLGAEHVEEDGKLPDVPEVQVDPEDDIDADTDFLEAPPALPVVPDSPVEPVSDAELEKSLFAEPDQKPTQPALPPVQPSPVKRGKKNRQHR